MPQDSLGGDLAVPLEVLARRLGRAPADLIRLDSDDNPYGPSLRVLEVLGSADSLHRPGDPEARDLRALLEPYACCARDRITVGAGPAESLERLLRALARPGAVVLVPALTRPLYAAVAARVGLPVVTVPGRGLELDIDGYLRLIGEQAVALAVVPTPNDPTGTTVAPTEIVRLLQTDVPVLVDESDYEFAGRTVVPLVTEFDNLIVLRDFAAWAGLAGLPVSYLLSARPLAAQLRQAAVFGGVTSAPAHAAQLAAGAALGDLAALQGNLRTLRQERGRLFRRLRKLNLIQPYPSEAHFLLCAVTRGQAAAIRDFLADEAGVIVRAIATPLLPNHLRISVGLPDQTDALFQGLLRLAEQHPL